MTTDSSDILSRLHAVRSASRSLLEVPSSIVDGLLLQTADALVENTPAILEANAADLAKLDPADPKFDRLKLTPERIAAIAGDMRAVAALPSPAGIELEDRTLPNGLRLRKVSVPFGVVGVIFEARPNVSCDVASLCLKSGNACVLKGGHEAAESNKALVGVIHDVLRRNGLSEDLVTLLPPTREATSELLAARGLVDLIIPRGSSGLIDYVRRNATVPVIETGAGVCHAYFESTASADMAAAIVCNAKTRRISVCNALDCLLVDSTRLADLPQVCAPLAAHKVVVHADPRAFEALSGSYPAELLVPLTDEDLGREYLSYAMSVITVDGLDAAIEHISRYGSGHSESIITSDDAAATRFQTLVDAACVYVNAPTSWTDGAQFGLGAEIGISTQKLHARGPMALRELTTYKWLISGSGQLRP